MMKIISKKSLLWISTVLWMTLIFLLSAQEAVQSDGLSLGIVGKILEFISDFDGFPAINTIDTEYLIRVVSSINFFVRKMAHFMLFAILSVLVYNLVFCYIFKRTKVIMLSSLICLVYAVSDEIHQLFVPGRAGQFRDVIIDFSGVLTALLIIFLISNYRIKRIKK